VGVGVHEGKVIDTYQTNVLEPVSVKKQVIKSATEASTMILKIDDVIAAAKMKPPKMPKGPEGAGY